MAESVPRFLFAVLQIDRICVARTVKKIKLALESMPNELDELYRQTVDRIRRQPGDDGELGIRVLSWVTHAKRPLRVEEIQHALAVENDEDEDPPSQLDFDNILSPQTLTDLCAGLVVIDLSSQIIRLVHYTTQEFFDRERQKFFADTDHEISRVCLTYLSYDVASVFPRDDYLSEMVSAYPFFGYSALYWSSHLRSIGNYDTHLQSMLEEGDGVVRPTLTNLCDDNHRATFEKAEAYIDDTDKLLFSTMLLRKLLLRPSAYGRISERDLLDRRHSIPLEAASECGLLDLAQLLLTQSKFAWDTKSTMGAALNKAMIQASVAGHTPIVRLLLTKRLFPRYDLNPVYDNLSIAPALLAACKYGHIAVAELLVHSGVGFKADQWNWKPLHYAAYGGHAEIVAFLLGIGANRFAQTPLGLTACHIAAERGYLEVVVLLLENTVACQWPTTLKKNSVLHSAAADGHLNVISLLLSKGFDPWAKNGSGKNARELVPNNQTVWVEAAFSRYTELSFVSQVTADSSTANAILETPESRYKRLSDKSYDFDADQVDGINKGPKLCLIMPTPDGSVAGSSEKGSSRSPSPEPPVSPDVRE